MRYGFRDVGTVIGNPVGTLPSLPATVVSPGLVHRAARRLDGAARGRHGGRNPGHRGPGPALPGAPATLVIAAAAAPSTPSSFDPPLRAPLRLLFDLVAVSRGSTVTAETLGSGNAAVANQTFTLKKSPLTYLASGAGWSSTLQVYVDGIHWSEVPSFYGQPRRRPGVRHPAQPRPSATVTLRGRRQRRPADHRHRQRGGHLPLRLGGGQPARRAPDHDHQAQPNLAAIHNPVAVPGGARSAVPRRRPKTNAPASVFSFGRAISAADYEVIASQAPGVTRAKAYWTFDAGTAAHSGQDLRQRRRGRRRGRVPGPGRGGRPEPPRHGRRGPGHRASR